METVGWDVQLWRSKGALNLNKTISHVSQLQLVTGQKGILQENEVTLTDDGQKQTSNSAGKN